MNSKEMMAMSISEIAHKILKIKGEIIKSEAVFTIQLLNDFINGLYQVSYLKILL